MSLGRCHTTKVNCSKNPTTLLILSPGGRKLNFSKRHLRLIQGLIGIMIFCIFLLLFPLGLISTHATPTGVNLNFRENSNDLSISGRDNEKDSQLTPDFGTAPDTSGINYNYLYNDGDNYQDEGEGLPISSKLGNDATNAGDSDTDANSENNANSLNGGGKSVSKAVLTRRRNKFIQNSHHKRRQKLLDSVFLSVKTTKRFHSTRLEPILKTWFNLAREQTWIFTDADDPVLDKRTGGHMINTNCPSTHYRQALCCKMSAEFDTFIHSKKSWFCHVDDDNYVNVPALLDLLEKYDPKEYWYLGKPSLKQQIVFKDPDNKSEDVSFWFGTGGAGFCLSRALALRMSPLASGGKFMKICDRIQLPDDVTIGYVAGHLLGQNLTVIPQFHSHFETMKFVSMKNPEPEITFSYMRTGENVNILDVQGYFSEDEDPTRFLSLHCLLFPNFSFCPKGMSSSRKR